MEKWKPVSKFCKYSVLPGGLDDNSFLAIQKKLYLEMNSK